MPFSGVADVWAAVMCEAGRRLLLLFFLKHVLKWRPAFVRLSVFMCVRLPSREAFHEVVANTLESWRNSEPGKTGNEQDFKLTKLSDPWQFPPAVDRVRLQKRPNKERQTTRVAKYSKHTHTYTHERTCAHTLNTFSLFDSQSKIQPENYISKLINIVNSKNKNS